MEKVYNRSASLVVMINVRNSVDHSISRFESYRYDLNSRVNMHELYILRGKCDEWIDLRIMKDRKTKEEERLIELTKWFVNEEILDTDGLTLDLEKKESYTVAIHRHGELLFRSTQDLTEDQWNTIDKLMTDLSNSAGTQTVYTAEAAGYQIPVNNGVEMAWGKTENFPKYLLYREGELL